MNIDDKTTPRTGVLKKVCCACWQNGIRGIEPILAKKTFWGALESSQGGPHEIAHKRYIKWEYASTPHKTGLMQTNVSPRVGPPDNPLSTCLLIQGRVFTFLKCLPLTFWSCETVSISSWQYWPMFKLICRWVQGVNIPRSHITIKEKSCSPTYD